MKFSAIKTILFLAVIAIPVYSTNNGDGPAGNGDEPGDNGNGSVNNGNGPGDNGDGSVDNGNSLTKNVDMPIGSISAESKNETSPRTKGFRPVISLKHEKESNELESEGHFCIKQGYNILSNGSMYQIDTKFLNWFVLGNGILMMTIVMTTVSYAINRYMRQDRFQLSINIILIIASIYLARSKQLGGYFYDYLCYNMPVIYYLFYIAHPYSALSCSGYLAQLLLANYFDLHQKIVDNSTIINFTRSYLAIQVDSLASLVDYSIGVLLGYMLLLFSPRCIYNNYVIIIGISFLAAASKLIEYHKL